MVWYGMVWYGRGLGRNRGANPHLFECHVRDLSTHNVADVRFDLCARVAQPVHAVFDPACLGLLLHGTTDTCTHQARIYVYIEYKRYLNMNPLG